MSDTQTEARAIAAVRDWLNGGCSSWGLPSQQIETLLTALAANDAELARLREFERQHDYCCCGDRIDAHNIGSGHAPVSVFDYEYGRAVERAERAEAQLAEANRKIAERDKALANYDRWLNERDAYIVRKGLWQNFVASLPGSPTARRALEAQGGENGL